MQNEVKKDKVRPLLATSSVVRNLLNSKVGAWPAQPIDLSGPFQWQDRRLIKQVEYEYKFQHNPAIPASAFYAGKTITPPINVGDVLYVREAFTKNGIHTLYRADWPKTERLGIADAKWTPSIHMPKELSRIHLEVMKVRVERACDISEEDARAEGCEPEDWRGEHPMTDYVQVHEGGRIDIYNRRNAFRRLWQSIYPDSWDKWVWVYDLKRIK